MQVRSITQFQKLNRGISSKNALHKNCATRVQENKFLLVGNEARLCQRILLVEGEKIEFVGPADGATILQGAQGIDLSGGKYSLEARREKSGRLAIGPRSPDFLREWSRTISPRKPG
jgi:hypothetical protein